MNPGCILQGHYDGMQIIQVKFNVALDIFLLSHFRLTKAVLLIQRKKYLENPALILLLSISTVDVQGAPQLS